MNIAGVLVHAHPDKLGIVERSLDRLPGVEIHQSAGDGRLVITVEDTGAVSSGDTILAVHRLDGVLSAALVYHHFEPDFEQVESEERADAAIEA